MICNKIIHPLLSRDAALAFFATVVISLLNLPIAKADFIEDWETPALPRTIISTTLPSSWKRTGSSADSRIGHTYGTAQFNQTHPLAAPAGGNQSILLSGGRVFRMTGVLIQTNSIYELSAAIGNNALVENTHLWSLQLWADSNNSNSFEDSSGGDVLIREEYGTSSTAINATDGDWALNSCSFDSSTMPDLTGKQLIVLVRSFGVATSFIDNVRFATIPEPSTLILGGIGFVGLLFAARRRSTESKQSENEHVKHP